MTPVWLTTCLSPLSVLLGYLRGCDYIRVTFLGGELVLLVHLLFTLFQDNAGEPIENEAHPRRLQFGFGPELEKLVHDKVESSGDL